MGFFCLGKKKLQSLERELTGDVCCLPRDIHGVIALFQATEGIISMLHLPTDKLYSSQCD